VYHQAAGDWYVLQSGSGWLRKQNWGWSLAQPVLRQYQINMGLMAVRP
jgi:hypothetical protein